MWAIWGLFVGFLERALVYFSTLSGSVGIGILLFTIVARLLILPLTLRSIKSSRKMSELQPQIKELQRKYGKDREKLMQETMDLYKREKVNPAGGCLPLLLQLPIFFGVYQAVVNLTNPALHGNLSPAIQQLIATPEVQQIFSTPFLGLIDLGRAAWVTAPPEGVALPPGVVLGFQGAIYLALPILSLVVQLVQQVMAMPRVMDPQQKAMMQAMLVMPFVFGYFAFTFPSGAVLYWVISGLLGILQQYFITGWGSLANYLTFLPPDRPLVKPLPTVAMVESAGGTGAGEAALPAQRVSFWGVLQPLIDQDGEQDGGTVEEASGEPSRRVQPAPNPRRPRRRR
jgi:YidC/Oxa1 family membrane protein insertase